MALQGKNMLRLRILAVVILAGPLAGAMGQLSQPAGSGTLILNEHGYFRQLYTMGLMRISGRLLKSEGAALLGPEPLRRLEAQTKKHLRALKIDWTKQDWRDHACVHFFRGQCGDDSSAIEMMPTLSPPGDWATPGFDDHTWMKRRVGQLPPTQSYDARVFADNYVQCMYLRSYFVVPDPVACGDLTISLSYRGGARALVNATEVARGHLWGEGETAGHALEYPREAYISLPDEVPPQRKAGICGEIRRRFADAAPASKGGKDFRAQGVVTGVSGEGEGLGQVALGNAVFAAVVGDPAG